MRLIFEKNTNVKVRADREWVYLTVDRQIGDCTCEGRHICSELKEEPIEGGRVCMHRWNWCITTPDTHTQMHHASVCAQGENTITHHVDWALGRSLLKGRVEKTGLMNNKWHTEKDTGNMRKTEKKCAMETHYKGGVLKKEKRINRVERGRMKMRKKFIRGCLVISNVQIHHLSDVFGILIDVLCFTRAHRERLLKTWIEKIPIECVSLLNWHRHTCTHTDIHTLKCKGRREVGADSLQQPQRLSRPTSLSGSRQGLKMDGTGKAVREENAGRLTTIRNVFLSP